jgi:hypothetical protein
MVVGGESALSPPQPPGYFTFISIKLGEVLY